MILSAAKNHDAVAVVSSRRITSVLEDTRREQGALRCGAPPACAKAMPHRRYDAAIYHCSPLNSIRAWTIALWRTADPSPAYGENPH